MRRGNRGNRRLAICSSRFATRQKRCRGRRAPKKAGAATAVAAAALTLPWRSACSGTARARWPEGHTSAPSRARERPRSPGSRRSPEGPAAGQRKCSRQTGRDASGARPAAGRGSCVPPSIHSWMGIPAELPDDPPPALTSRLGCQDSWPHWSTAREAWCAKPEFGTTCSRGQVSHRGSSREGESKGGRPLRTGAVGGAPLGCPATPPPPNRLASAPLACLPLMRRSA